MGRTVVNIYRPLSMTGKHEYVVEFEDLRWERFKCKAHLLRFFDSKQAESFINLTVFAYHGERHSWLRRILGLGQTDIELCLTISKVDQYASIIFADENGSVYWAIDEVYPVYPMDDVRLALAMGELTPISLEWCMDAKRALQAVRDFIENGRRPEWLSYHFVK